MAKKKVSQNAKGEGKGRGRESWAPKPKLELLESFMDLFFQDRGAMYMQATNAFIEKWGYDLDPNAMLEENRIYTTPDINAIEEGEEREKEQVRRTEFRRRLHDKIANWARHRWNRKACDFNTIMKMMTSILKSATDQPKKPSEVRFYQREYYTRRVKDEFDAHWATIKDHLKPDCWVREMNAFTRKKWAREPEEFKKELRETLEGQYTEEMEAWKKREEWSGDAFSYEMAWIKVDDVLPIVSETISKMFGAGCTIFLYGPCGSGKATVSSTCSIIPGATTNKDIQQFDAATYSAMHSLCQRYANAAFSSEYVKTRITSVPNKDGSVANEGTETEILDRDNSCDLPSALSAKSNSNSESMTPNPVPAVPAALSQPLPQAAKPPHNVNNAATPDQLITMSSSVSQTGSPSLATPLVTTSAPLPFTQAVQPLSAVYNSVTPTGAPICLPKTPLPVSQTLCSPTNHALKATVASSLPDNTYDLSTHELMNPYASNASAQYNNPEVMMGMDINDWSQWQAMKKQIGGQDKVSSSSPVFDANGTLVMDGSSNIPALNSTSLLLNSSPMFDADRTLVTDGSPNIPALNSTSRSSNSSPMFDADRTLVTAGINVNSVMEQQQHTLAYSVATQRPTFTELPQQIHPSIAKPVAEGKENTRKRKRDINDESSTEKSTEAKEVEASAGRKKRNVKAPEREPKTITGETNQSSANKKSKGKRSGAKGKGNANAIDSKTNGCGKNK